MTRWRTRILFSVLLAAGSSGCSAGLPAPLATYPKTVDIVDLGVEAKPEGTRAFGWPATKKNPTGKHSRRLVVESAQGPRQVTMECGYEFTEASCSRITVNCTPQPSGLPFSLTLSADGSMVFNGSSTGSGTNEKYWAIVDMNQAEREGQEFRETATRAIQLGPEILEPKSCDWIVRGERSEWGAQLAWTQEDKESSGELIRPERVGTPDREFNLLSTNEGHVYVSVHQAHPEYETALAALATAGNLWAKNRGSFARCPAPPTGSCNK